VLDGLADALDGLADVLHGLGDLFDCIGDALDPFPHPVDGFADLLDCNAPGLQVVHVGATPTETPAYFDNRIEEFQRRSVEYARQR
jgi:hypothetical protein